MAEDSELWDVICDGPFIPTKNLGDPAVAIPNMRKEFNDVDRKAIEKNFRTKKFLVCGIGPDEYNRISACQSAKEIWEALQTSHEGTTQVKQSKIDMLTTEYKLFRIKDNESIQDMHTRFTSIINELHSLCETIPRNKLVMKILSVLPSSWESKVNAITEVKDLRTLTIDKLVVKSEVTEYDSIFALMAQSNDDDDDELMSLANVLIDAYHSLINDKDALTMELGEAEQTRDDLVIVVVDLKEIIENLKKEKDEHERDDLMVVVVDLKENFECVRKEKEVLAERVANIEHERDDLLVVVVDLKETIGKPKIESRPENSQKGKKIASEAHIKLEKLGKEKSDLEKSLKWTWSSDVITAMYTNNGGNKQGIGFQREKIPYNPHRNLLSVSQICEKGNKVEFVSKIYTVTNIETGEVMLVAKRYKYIYVTDFESLQNGDLNCLSAIDDDAELWHMRLGHASFMLLKNLYMKDLVRGPAKSSFKDHKVCDACVKDKQVRSSFKPKKEVSTSKSLDLLHMDLCGPMRVESRGGNKYIFVIVDDYSRFTWTLFLITKDETFEVFFAFVKRIQVKMGNNVACIRCLIRSLLNKTPYELLNGRKPKLTHLRTFGYKCFVLNNGKEALGKLDAKSDEGIFLGYSSQSKAYKDIRVDQDGEPLSVPCEVIDMTNGKADMMSHAKESSKDDANTSPSIGEEPGPMITTIEAENRVADAVQGTPLAEITSGQEPQSDIPGSSTNEIQVPNWKHKSSHPLDNIITPLDSGVQTRSKARNSLTFSAFLSQIEPQNIKEALKDAYWITTMQEELHQFERNKPLGFESHEHPEHVFKLDKALYGLKQAHRAWYERLSKFLLENGFTREKIDNTLFLKKLGRNLLIVQQSQKGTLISQQKYIKELLRRFDMEASKVIDTSIATATRLDMDEPSSLVNQTMYRGIIGSLLYLSASRPDIVFSVGTRKQNSVALSTAKAEYVAAASCCAQLLWIKQQLEDFGVFSDCVPLLCDNISALNMAKNPVQHKRSKHIDVRHHFLRDNVEKGLICMKFCSTEDQIADIFTKALSREHFERNRLALYALVKRVKLTDVILVREPGSPDTGNTPFSIKFSIDVQEKETIENMMSIAHEGVVIEGDNDGFGTQGEESKTMKEDRELVPFEQSAQDNTTGVPNKEPDSSQEDLTQGSSQEPQVSIDPTSSPYFDAEPLCVVIPEERCLSREKKCVSKEDSDNMQIASLTRRRPMVAQESTPKRPTTRLQRKEALESVLKNSQAKSRRRKLVKDGKVVREKSVLVVNVDDEVEEEPSSLTRKRSQKHGLPKPKRGSSVSVEGLNKSDDVVVASKSMVKESDDKLVEESAARVMEEFGEKSVKSDEKGKSVCKYAKRRADTDKEPSSSKKARMSDPRNTGKERLRCQKVLWGRTFASDILEEAGMRQLVEICEFQQWTHLFTNDAPMVYEEEVH
ncbi:uncharacterized protein LOC142168954 [Nicotiana tabacum]|uniref:Uncharacterized protein LOC142168954 n=1 Tax=Nicotiana tabacum TaxID=4097 RepID=A0AC58SMP3_TOBAC